MHSRPTVHDLRWAQGKRSPGVRIWGFQNRFLVGIVQRWIKDLGRQDVKERRQKARTLARVQDFSVILALWLCGAGQTQAGGNKQPSK